MTERIIGKVADVTSDRELILNRGSEHGVDTDTYFHVKGDPVDITDPDTGESLGSVNKIKVVVRVQEVSEKFCIARTFRSRKIKVGGGRADPGGIFGLARNPLAEALQPPKYETRVETFRLDPKKGAPISMGESVVERGDTVESVLEGEDIDPVTTTLFR